MLLPGTRDCRERRSSTPSDCSTRILLYYCNTTTTSTGTFLHTSRYTRLLGAAQLNAFELHTSTGIAISCLLPPLPSCFNHSCAPNVRVYRKARRAQIPTAQPILAATESASWKGQLRPRLEGVPAGVAPNHRVGGSARRAAVAAPRAVCGAWGVGALYTTNYSAPTTTILLYYDDAVASLRTVGGALDAAVASHCRTLARAERVRANPKSVPATRSRHPFPPTRYRQRM